MNKVAHFNPDGHDLEADKVIKRQWIVMKGRGQTTNLVKGGKKWLLSCVDAAAGRE